MLAQFGLPGGSGNNFRRRCVHLAGRAAKTIASNEARRSRNAWTTRGKGHHIRRLAETLLQNRSRPTLCRTSITGTFPTGQIAVRVDLIEREGERSARLQLFVPVGMYLQHAVKLTVEQGSSYRLPYNWCVTNSCIAADVADPKIIKEMESGKTLTLQVIDSNLLSLTTSLPLGQFASVHKGAPAQTLEQYIDE
jgi:hypothetical protein